MKIFGVELFPKKPASSPVGGQEGPPKDYDEIGAPGTVFYSGFLDGEEYNADLQGDKAIEVYTRMMRSDGMVKAMMRTITLPIRACTLRVVPASDEKSDVHIANVVEHNLLNMDGMVWDDLVRQIITSSCGYGHAVHELVFCRPDGKPNIKEIDGQEVIALYKLAPRLPKTIYRWHIDRYGELQGITQMTYVADTKRDFEVKASWSDPSANLVGGIWAYPTIPISRLFVMSLDREGANFRGESILRSAYKHWFYKDMLLRIGAIAAERHGIGVPYAIVREGIKDTERRAVAKALQSLHAHEKGYFLAAEDSLATGLNFPPFGILDMKATSLRSTDAQINYHDRQMAVSILADFLTLGSGIGGNANVMHRDKSSLFFNALKGIVAQFEQAMTLYVVKRIVDLNWPDTVAYPKIELAGLETKDITPLGQSLAALVTAGMISPDAELENHIRDLFDLPSLPADDEGNPIRPSPPPPISGPPGVIPGSPGTADPGESGKPGARDQLPIPGEPEEVSLYSPDQERDEQGKWTDGGGGGNYGTVKLTGSPETKPKLTGLAKQTKNAVESEVGSETVSYLFQDGKDFQEAFANDMEVSLGGRTPERADIVEARQQIYDQTQYHLANGRNLPEEFTVYRGGASRSDNPNSLIPVSLSRGVAEQWAERKGESVSTFTVGRSNVLVDMEAFAPGLEEEELLVPLGALSGVKEQSSNLYSPDQERDEQGKWTDGGGDVEYHGTSPQAAAAIKEMGFDEHAATSWTHPNTGLGFFFTHSEAEARAYADEDGVVLAAQVDLENPRVAEDWESLKTEVIQEARGNIFPKGEAGSIGYDIKEHLQAKGYDGVILKNPWLSETTQQDRSWVIAFDQSRITLQKELAEGDIVYIAYRSASSSKKRSWKRELRESEKVVNFSAIDNALTEGLSRLKAAGKEPTRALSLAILARKKTKRLETKLAAALQPVLNSLHRFGARQVLKEYARARGRRLAEGPPELPNIPHSSLAPDLAKRISGRITFFMEHFDGIPAEEEILSAAETALNIVARYSVTTPLNEGRSETAKELQDEIRYAERSSLLDSATCNECETLDGEQYELGSADYDENEPPSQCAGGDNCRCVYVYVFEDEGD
jgi:hypothetical protein